MFSKGTILAAIFVAAVTSSPGQADIIFTASPSGTGANVLFNLQPSDQMGNPIFGNINDPLNTLVTFGSNELLITPSGGQARVEAADGSLNLLEVSLAALPGFDSAIFNLNAEPGTGTATITAFNQFGVSEMFSLSLGPGQNFFTLTTDDLQYITNVVISSTLGLDDVRQIRLAAVPGPVAGSGIVALLWAIGALGLLVRHRRLKA